MAEDKATDATQPVADKSLDELVEDLASPSRRRRLAAARELSAFAKTDVDALRPHVKSVIDALSRPEAQTRWEMLDVLIAMCDAYPESLQKALPEVETALFDEESGLVRLGALRFLCVYGGSTEKRSEKVWPLLNEAIQCYHGDQEFGDMLVALTGFASGRLAPEVKDALRERMSFDAEHAKGALKKRALLIVESLDN